MQKTKIILLNYVAKFGFIFSLKLDYFEDIHEIDSHLKVTAVNEYCVRGKVLVGDTLCMSQFDLFADIMNYRKFVVPIELGFFGNKHLELLLLKEVIDIKMSVVCDINYVLLCLIPLIQECVSNRLVGAIYFDKMKLIACFVCFFSYSVWLSGKRVCVKLISP